MATAPKAKGFTNGDKPGRRKPTYKRRVANKSKVIGKEYGYLNNQPKKAADYFRSLFGVRGIILAVSLLQLIVVSVGISRWYEELGQRPSDFYPNNELTIPMVLVLVSVMLLISRWWSHLIAFVASGWVIYFLGYVALRADSRARDVPLLSSEALRVWFAQKYLWQRQELFSLVLTFVICLYVFISLVRLWRRGRLQKASL